MSQSSAWSCPNTGLDDFLASSLLVVRLNTEMASFIAVTHSAASSGELAFNSHFAVAAPPFTTNVFLPG